MPRSKHMGLSAGKCIEVKIGFAFVPDWRRMWREILQPITKRGFAMSRVFIFLNYCNHMHIACCCERLRQEKSNAN